MAASSHWFRLHVHSCSYNNPLQDTTVKWLLNVKQDFFIEYLPQKLMKTCMCMFVNNLATTEVQKEKTVVFLHTSLTSWVPNGSGWGRLRSSINMLSILPFFAPYTKPKLSSSKVVKNIKMHLLLTKAA